MCNFFVLCNGSRGGKKIAEPGVLGRAGVRWRAGGCGAKRNCRMHTESVGAEKFLSIRDENDHPVAPSKIHVGWPLSRFIQFWPCFIWRSANFYFYFNSLGAPPHPENFRLELSMPVVVFDDLWREVGARAKSDELFERRRRRGGEALTAGNGEFLKINLYFVGRGSGPEEG